MIDALYERHHSWLHGWLTQRLGCQHIAADRAHDTFVRLLTKHNVVIRKPRTYLTTIAQGLVLNHWRRIDIERAYLAALADQPLSYAPSPEQRELAIEALEAIIRLLEAMTPRTRTIFLLSQVDGLSYPQIAEQLGLSVNIVRKDLAKALKHCYAALYD